MALICSSRTHFKIQPMFCYGKAAHLSHCECRRPCINLHRHHCIPAAMIWLKLLLAQAVRMAGRNRADVTAATLAECFEPHAVRNGMSFCTYSDENEMVKKSRLDISAVQKHRHLIKDIHAACEGNLCLKKSDVKAALTILYKKLGHNWSMNSVQREDWLETLTRRIRNMTQNVQQAVWRRPTWIQNELPFMAPDAKNDDVTAGEASEASAKANFYGYDSEINLAWRATPGAKHKDISQPLKVEDGANDSDPVFATWEDGDSHVVPGLTAGQLKNISASQAPTAKGSGTLWSGEHIPTKHKLTINQKVDRTLLIVLFEQSKCILILRVNLFGALEDASKTLPKNDPVLQKAVNFMVPIAQLYATADIERHMLIKVRNDRLQDISLAPKPKKSNIKKRPAASMDTAETDTGDAPPLLKRPSHAPDTEKPEPVKSILKHPADKTPENKPALDSMDEPVEEEGEEEIGVETKSTSEEEEEEKDKAGPNQQGLRMAEPAHLRTDVEPLIWDDMPNLPMTTLELLFKP